MSNPQREQNPTWNSIPESRVGKPCLTASWVDAPQVVSQQAKVERCSSRANFLWKTMVGFLKFAPKFQREYLQIQRDYLCASKVMDAPISVIFDRRARGLWLVDISASLKPRLANGSKLRFPSMNALLIPLANACAMHHRLLQKQSNRWGSLLRIKSRAISL